MKILIHICIIVAVALFTACNHYVFVERPEPVEPPVDVPEPEPEIDDSLILKTLVYDDASLSLSSESRVLDATINFENYTASSGVTVLYNNYNSSLVTISSPTYFVTPWARTGQPLIKVPGLDSENTPGFYGAEIPFAFGNTVIPRQYMADHREYFDLPPYSKVTATVYITYRTVSASADIKYFRSSSPSSLDDGLVDVKVAVPVDIKVRWSEIISLK